MGNTQPFSIISPAGPYYQPESGFLSALGDDSVDIENTPWYDIGTQLGQAQTQLSEMLQAMIGDSTLAAAIGRGVTQAQADIGDAIYQYNRIAGIIGAPTLSGFQITAAAGAAIIALAIAAGVAVHEVNVMYQAYLAAKQKSALTSQAQTILSQANAKAAAGDAAGAAALYAQYQALLSQANAGTTFNLADFFNQNAPYLVAGAVLLAMTKGR